MQIPVGAMCVACGVSRTAMGVMAPGIGVMLAMPAAACEETAMAPPPDGAIALPGRMSPNPARVFRFAAGEVGGATRLAQGSPVVTLRPGGVRRGSAAEKRVAGEGTLLLARREISLSRARSPTIPMSLYDVFLSHASADKTAVEFLAHKLKTAEIKPFLDKWHLVAGERWQEALEDAVAQSSSCAVFFGPVSKGGAWRNEETRLALIRAAEDPSFRVIPVLLPGAKEEEVSGFLRLRTWFDFRTGLDDAGALARFIVSIQGKAPDDDGGGAGKPPLPYRSMAPAREPFVQRNEYAKVRDALLADGSARSTTVGTTTAIHGAGGFGKTALAIELCYERVRAQFSGPPWARRSTPPAAWPGSAT